MKFCNSFRVIASDSTSSPKSVVLWPLKSFGPLPCPGLDPLLGRYCWRCCHYQKSRLFLLFMVLFLRAVFRFTNRAVPGKSRGLAGLNPEFLASFLWAFPTEFLEDRSLRRFLFGEPWARFFHVKRGISIGVRVGGVAASLGRVPLWIYELFVFFWLRCSGFWGVRLLGCREMRR